MNFRIGKFGILTGPQGPNGKFVTILHAKSEQFAFLPRPLALQDSYFIFLKPTIVSGISPFEQRRMPRKRPSVKMPQSGFTLIELLVVIAILGILAALLLPMITNTRQKANSVNCLMNLKQLQLCSHLYSIDNYDFFVPNNAGALLDPTSNNTPNALSRSPFPSGNFSWCVDHDAKTQLDSSNILRGLLFPYNTSLAIYHCPADASHLEDDGGQILPQLRWRSYNMSQSINGDPDPLFLNFIPSYKKNSEIKGRLPSGVFVFIDEHQECISDADFGMPTDQFGGSGDWWDVPANRHNQGANISFADGHVEHWKWIVPKTSYSPGSPQSVPQEEMPDYQRVRDCMKLTQD